MNDKTYEFLKNITGKDGNDLLKLLEHDPDLLRFVAAQENLELLRNLSDEDREALTLGRQILVKSDVEK